MGWKNKSLIAISIAILVIIFFDLFIIRFGGGNIEMFVILPLGVIGLFFGIINRPGISTWTKIIFTFCLSLLSLLVITIVLGSFFLT